MIETHIFRASGRYNIGLVLVAFLGLLAIVAYDEYVSWTGETAQVEQNLTQSSSAIIQHVDDTVQMTESLLDALLVTIISRDVDGHNNLRLHAEMKRLARLSGRIDSFSFINPDGRVAVSSRDAYDPAVDLSDREYFRFHKENPGTQSLIGKPVWSRIGGGWVLTISRRYERPDGQFGGVLIAALPLKYLTDFFSKFDVGTKGTFLLVRGDGIVLARGPEREDMYAMDISSHELFTRHLVGASSGVYEYQSPVDRERRFGAFARSPQSGIVILTAASRQETLADWSAAARIRWTSFGLILALAGIAAWRWAHQTRLRRESEMALAAREAEFRLLAESSSHMIQRLDANGIQVYVSPAAADVLGIAPAALLGRNIVAGLDGESAQRVREVLHKLRFGTRGETVVLKREVAGGREIWLEIAFSRMPTTADGLGGFVAITRDVTRQKLEQEQLDALANTDALTGLANRRAFDNRLRLLTDGPGDRAAPLSLLMIDADRFKLYNDTYGHAEGDVCLKAIAGAVMQNVSRRDDCAARFGGEEVAVLLPGTGLEGAMVVAQAICASVANLGLEHSANQPWGVVTVSVGVATLPAGPREPLSAETLFHCADKALYQAKESGRNRVVADTSNSTGGHPRMTATG